MRRPLCWACVAFVATVFIYLILNPVTYNEFECDEGTGIKVLGEVTSKEYRNDKLIIYLNNIRIYNEGGGKVSIDKTDISELMCYTEYDKEFSAPTIGNQILVEGKVSYFEETRNPGEFNLRLYYKILGIEAKLYNTTILRYNNNSNIYKEKLYNIRCYFENIYDIILDEKDASIMKAMVLGNKTELDYDSKQLFQKSGIAHVFAISGLHITLLGMGLYNLLKKLRIPKPICCIVPVCMMFVYGDMVGMSSSAIRAIVMFGLRLMAKLLKRTYDMLTAISIAGVLILIEQPLYLYHSGYLLSFGAVIGICCLLDVVYPIKPGRKLKWYEKVKASILGSLSIFLVHFPIMICVYYEFPVYSFLLNLVIIPAMTVVMFLGVACLAVGSIPASFLLIVAKIFGSFCHVILAIFEYLCKFSLKLAGARWTVGFPNLFRILVYVAVIVCLYVMHDYGVRFSKKKDCVDRGLAVMLPPQIRYIAILAAVLFISRRVIPVSSINFIDVGQGDAIYVEGTDGAGFLIDGGSTSESQVAKYTIVPYLKYRGVSKLDGVFLTHLDKDHTSGIIDMLSQEGVGEYNIDIRRIFISDSVIEDEAYDELVGLCDNKNIPIYRLKTGDELGSGEVRFTVLHPSNDYVADSRNSYSLVMKLSIGDGEDGDVTALLTGDVSEDGENMVAKYLNGDIDIYKAAHHGSKNSNKSGIINAALPKLCVISCGAGNSYGHPHSEAVDNFKNVGSDIIVTKDTGAIEIKINGGKYKVETYLE